MFAFLFCCYFFSVLNFDIFVPVSFSSLCTLSFLLELLYVPKYLVTVNPLLSAPGGLFFSSTFFFGGGGLFNLVKRINGSKVSRGRTCGSRALYCFF